MTVFVAVAFKFLKVNIFAFNENSSLGPRDIAGRILALHDNMGLSPITNGPENSSRSDIRARGNTKNHQCGPINNNKKLKIIKSFHLVMSLMFLFCRPIQFRVVKETGYSHLKY